MHGHDPTTTGPTGPRTNTSAAIEMSDRDPSPIARTVAARSCGVLDFEFCRGQWPSPLRRDPSRRRQRYSRPREKFVRFVEQPLRRASKGEVYGTALFSQLRVGKDSASLTAARLWSSTTGHGSPIRNSNFHCGTPRPGNYCETRPDANGRETFAGSQARIRLAIGGRRFRTCGSGFQKNVSSIPLPSRQLAGRYSRF